MAQERTIGGIGEADLIIPNGWGIGTSAGLQGLFLTLGQAWFIVSFPESF
jgi:hypothetical protein